MSVQDGVGSLPVIAKIDYESTIGAFEGGTIAALFLYGICTVQAYTYLRTSAAERKRMKLFVVAIWIFEGIHSIIVAYTLFWITVDNFGETTRAIRNPLKKLWLASTLSAITTSSIQCFFAYRLYLITGAWATPSICALLSAVSLVGQFVLAATGKNAPSVFQWQEHWRPLLLVTMGLATVSDALVALNLSCAFWRRRTAEFRSDVHQLVDKVIFWALETCLLTSVVMILMVILFMTMENFAWLAVWFVISRLFSSSLLASLNGRKRLRQQVINENLAFVEVQTHASGTLESYAHDGSRRPNPQTLAPDPERGDPVPQQKGTPYEDIDRPPSSPLSCQRATVVDSISLQRPPSRRSLTPSRHHKRSRSAEP